MPAQIAPIADHDRAEILDALRAFALLGILISHVPDFTGYNSLPEPQQALLDPFNIGPVDDGVTVRFIAEQTVAAIAPGAAINFGRGDKGWGLN